MKKLWYSLTLPLCLLTIPLACSNPQGNPQPLVQQKPLTILANGLPSDTENYTGWLKMNKDPIPPDSSSPHTPSQGNKNIYVNQERGKLVVNGAQQFPYPNGTLIVKEAVHKEKGHVELVAIMRKIDGIDPEHGNWQFHEYIRSGPEDKFRLAFKDSTCFGCHSQFNEKGTKTDWVKTTLAPE